MKQISTWEDMANIMTTLTGFTVLVGIFLAIYRNLTASLFDKLFMEGTDRTLIRVGKLFIDTICIFCLIVLYNVLPYFLCDILLTKVDDKSAKFMREIFNDLFQMMVVYLGLLLPVVFLSYTVVLKSKLNLFLRRGGFIKLVIILIEFTLLAICFPLFRIVADVIQYRWSNNLPIVFAIIGFILNMVMVLLEVALYIFFPWKNKIDVWKKGMSLVLSVSLVLYFLDIVHMAFYAKKPANCEKYLVSFIPIILMTVVLSAVTVKVINENKIVDSMTKTRSINFRGDPGISEKAENTIGFMVILSVLFILGPFLFKTIGFHLTEHNTKDGLMILRIFAEQIWQKIPLIIPIIILEWLLLWLTSAKGLVSAFDLNYAQARLIDIKNGEAYFAYTAYENRIMCGKEKTLDDKGMVSYIPLESIFNGDCCLRNCESEPLICKNAKSLIKLSAIIIDVSKSSSFQSEYPVGAKSIPKLGGNEKADGWDNGKSGRDIVKELLSKEGIKYDVNTNILVYCKEEIRSKIAAWRLIGFGYSNVYLCGSGCGIKMVAKDI